MEKHKRKKKVKVKAKLIQFRLRLPEFLDNRHMRVTRLSALHTVRLYPQNIPLILIFDRG